MASVVVVRECDYEDHIVKVKCKGRTVTITAQRHGVATNIARAIVKLLADEAPEVVVKGLRED